MERTNAGTTAGGDAQQNGFVAGNTIQPLDISEEKRQAQEAGRARPAPRDAEKKQDDHANDGEKKDNDQPAGGYDSTPIPYRPGGYTVKMTFHRATNLPMADINSLS